MNTRIEKDSMGEMRVPQDALYAAQTQRAVENFPISGLRFPRSFIRALALLKAAAGQVPLPQDALYAAQTQRAVENFPISGLRFPRSFIRALALIKAAAAH